MAQIGKLPFGSAATPNVWIDNDDAVDTYIELVSMAAAAAGKIKLHGISSTTSIQPFNPYISSATADKFGTERIGEYHDAIKSGFNAARVPTPSAVFKGHFSKPDSGNINDTKRLNMPSASNLVSAIHSHATPQNPMIVCCGGQLSIVADAYLQDPSIADKVVVSFVGHTSTGFLGYNEKCDPWATFIVCSRLRIASFPAGVNYRAIAPVVTKSRIDTDMPSSWIQSRAYNKKHSTNPLPDDRDADGLTVAAVIDRLNYVTGVTRMTVTGSVSDGGFNNLPKVAPSPNGNVYMIDAVNQQAGTDAWWSVTSNPSVYLEGTLPVLTSVAADNFNRPNSTILGDGWAPVGGTPRKSVITNQAGRSTGGSANDKRTETFAPDQYAQARFTSPPAAGNFPGLTTRFSSSGDSISGYQLFLNANIELQFQKHMVGAPRVPLLLGMPKPTAAQSVRLISQGSIHSIWLSSTATTHPLYVNGFELVGTIRDSTHASGTTALTSYFSTASSIDDWNSGNVTAETAGEAPPDENPVVHPPPASDPPVADPPPVAEPPASDPPPANAETQIGKLPFGSAATPNVWIDNDDAVDTYIELVSMAAAAAGKIKLHGISSTTSIQPFNPYISSATADKFGTERIGEYHDAIKSGFNAARVPIPSAVFKGHFTKPDSGDINDTRRLNMPSASNLVSAIHSHATPQNPMIVCCGGQLSIVADAYLQDPSIADKVVVSFVGHTTTGFLGYNEKCDPWATFIVCSRLRIASFPAGVNYRAIAPVVTKARIDTDMPSSWIQSRAYQKKHSTNPLPDDRDADGLTVAAVIDRLNYVTGVTRMTVTGSMSDGGFNNLPKVAPSPNGNIYMIDAVNQQAGTDAWWSVTSNPSVYLEGTLPVLTSVAADNFNRPNSTILGNGWAPVGGTPRKSVITNQAGRSTGGSANDKRTETFAPDQYAQARFTSPPAAGNFPGLTTRFSSSGDSISGYQLFLNANIELQFQKHMVGAPRVPLLLGMPKPTAAQSVRLISQGSIHSIWLSSTATTHPLHVNGFELVGTIRDSTHASGTTALTSYFSTASSIDDWNSGNVTAQ